MKIRTAVIPVTGVGGGGVAPGGASCYTAGVQLRTARLCLDCEEVHDEYRCPVCASDHFSYLTRWVPGPERPARPRPSPPPPPDVEVYRRLLRNEPPPAKGGRFFTRALVGAGALAGLASVLLGARGARAHGAREEASDDREAPEEGEAPGGAPEDGNG